MDCYLPWNALEEQISNMGVCPSKGGKTETRTLTFVNIQL